VEYLNILLAIINSGPGTIAGSIALVAVGFAGALYMSSKNVDAVTTYSKATREQISSLNEQIKTLSEELTQARISISALHKQNVELMIEVRSANKKIAELEDMLTKAKPESES
jgi:septal ring factor EnvC (AmiA/AmiB activator)